jgi:hypothetical protein
MRGAREHLRQQPSLERRVQFARGHWQRIEGAGAISAGWWESVTVTWSPAATPERRPALLRQAAAAAADALVPAIIEAAAFGARRLLERRADTRPALPASRPRRVLSAVARELPRPDRTR